VDRKPGFTASERILVLAPTGRDADLASAALTAAHLSCTVCANMEELCAHIETDAGAALITEEALTSPAMKCLSEALDTQPPWSDFPLIIFTSQPSDDVSARSFEPLGARSNVTLIERPIRVKTMISAARAALRARRRQYEVRELVRELERSVAERDQFLAMLSHELRNPLAAISLAIDALDSKNAPHEMERDVVVRQTRHLKKLVDDLLDISRITSGKIILQKNVVDLADIVEHCVETMKPRIEARRHKVQVHTAQGVIVNGDVVRLEQIANNLLSNAVKYTPPGGTIDVYAERDDGEAVLRVRDSGKGIPAEMLTRVFDLFMQGDVSIDRSEGGMGIGLTLVRKLTELHGGTVRAYSRGKGSGSEFVARFPIALETAKPEKKQRAAALKTTAPRRIVVIEDNADIRDLLRIKLRQLGHKVDVAPDGLKGLELLLRKKPDVALVDIGLPGMDGYDLARRVRQELKTDIYLVALTGYGQADDRARALEAGFDVHLTKPADIVDLQNVLGRATRTRAAS
jgi:signal transduction histidine kinase/ActR/RegA family two-component response regulator